MPREQLFKEIRSKWVTSEGPSSDVVLTSRIRLARNLRSHPFPHLMSEDQAKDLLSQLKDLVTLGTGRGDIGNLEFMPLSHLEPIDRQVLVEKHLISPDLARSRHPGAAVIMRDDEAVSIMINEEDHLRIQCLYPGLQLEECWKLANKLDDIVESKLDYAFDQNRGYLTACPTNVGTGLRASVMVHLPGLVMTQQIGRVLAAISQVGLVVRGLYGEGTESSGNIFQISNQITLGPSESEIMHNLVAVIKQIVEQERASRQALFKSNRVALEDRVFRSWGLLTNVRLLTSQEAMKLLSDVRLGYDLKLIPNINHRTLNELLVLTQPAMLQRYSQNKLADGERDYRRAELVRQCLQQLEGGK